MIAVLIGLFPPWIAIAHYRNGPSEYPVSYAFIAVPPTDKLDDVTDSLLLDFGRLAIEFAVLTVVTACAVLALHGLSQRASMKSAALVLSTFFVTAGVSGMLYCIHSTRQRSLAAVAQTAADSSPPAQTSFKGRSEPFPQVYSTNLNQREVPFPYFTQGTKPAGSQ
jgi:hypothetical protein